jgi:tetratricopeptide (TPR) repeat protein
LNGDYSDSFENIIKATSLNTLKPEIWYNLGILYEKCKQPEEALIAYSKVQDLNIGDPDSIQRINDIQSPFYNQNQGIFNLEMKQPSFNLPNSLTILNKYKNLMMPILPKPLPRKTKDQMLKTKTAKMAQTTLRNHKEEIKSI